MAQFSYAAMTKGGKRETGVIDADSEDELVLRLQAQGLIVTKVVTVTGVLDKSTAGAEKNATGYSKQSVFRRGPKFTHRGVKVYDLVFFARQLATLLGSGITLHKSLDALLKQIDSVSLHKAISKIKKDVESGVTLRDALIRHPKVFSELWANLIESGEASGSLPLVLDRLAKYLEMQANFQRKIVSAMLYPAILLMVALGAIFFFITSIVPTFSGLFKSFSAELPTITKILIELSNVVKTGFIPALICLVVLIFLFRQFRKTGGGKRIVDGVKLRLPVFGNFFKVLAVERFTSAMAILIEGGVPILYALEITERSVGNKILEAVIKRVKTSVREGRPLAELLERSGFFEPMVVQMISVGEEIGELAKMFRRVADFYDEYTETFIARFATVFEPIMLVFMGGVIGTMVVALFMPIFSIIGAASKGGF